MTIRQKVKNGFAILFLFLSIFLLLRGSLEGIQFVTCIAEIYLIIHAVNDLALYFSMARYMVGGKQILYRGILLINAILMIECLEALPLTYIMFYLCIFFLFAGILRLLKVVESLKIHDIHWMHHAVFTVWYFFLTVMAVINLHSTRIMIYLVCVELLTEAFRRISRQMIPARVKLFN